MDRHNNLSKISKITNNIFLSGIFPLDENYELIKKLNIKYILACLDRNFISEVHDKIMTNNPDLTILYLPYNDDIEQNLWETNKNKTQMIKYIVSIDDYNILTKQISIYNNKPMIEIGYNFIDNAVLSNKNILVHCMAGISRSVSMVIYYLMKKHHINYENAITIVKDRRPIANPNNSFKLQLQKYQKKRDNFTEIDAKNIIVSIKYPAQDIISPKKKEKK